MVMIGTPPVITTDISNQTVCAGVQLTWSVGATGSGLSYQWQRDGTNLVEGVGNFTGTTSATLTNSAIGLEDAAEGSRGFACIVSGSCRPRRQFDQGSADGGSGFGGGHRHGGELGRFAAGARQPLP